jgi:hypothetical protein
VVYTTINRTLHHWSYAQDIGIWNDGGIFGPADAMSGPGLIQSDLGQNAASGNFETIVLNSSEQLEHWSKNNSISVPAWQKIATFGATVAISGPALIQSHYGTIGNFELVCVLTNGQMQHWSRDNDAPGQPWSASATFGTDVSSAPCMIEGNIGAASEYAIGNFELCVAKGGKLEYWTRENNGDGLWHGPTMFGDGHEVAVLGLVQSIFGFSLELLAARDDGQVQHYWRDSASQQWHAGEFLPGINWQPGSFSLTQEMCAGFF